MLPQGPSVRRSQLWKPFREEHSRQEKQHIEGSGMRHVQRQMKKGLAYPMTGTRNRKMRGVELWSCHERKLG